MRLSGTFHRGVTIGPLGSRPELTRFNWHSHPPASTQKSDRGGLFSKAGHFAAVYPLRCAFNGGFAPMVAAPALLRIVRIRDITEHFGITPNQVRRLRRLDPSFPKPFRIGTGPNGTVAWFEGELNDWLTNRPRAVLAGVVERSVSPNP
jgi:predicted DNA-binding transcriptional regulator AlpA